jgi:hypothetical protein
MEFLATEQRCIVLPVRYELNLYMLCRRKWTASVWLQIQRYQIIREAVGLERGPLSLVSTIEELLGRKSSGSGLEIREYDRKDPLC